MTRTIRAGFTLTELLVALGVGLIVLNAAFVVFVNSAKFFKRIESVGTKAEVAESVMLSLLAKNVPTAGSDLDAFLAKGEKQFRRIGVTAITAPAAATDIHYIVTVDEIIGPGDKAVIQPVNIVVPRIGN